MSGWNSCSGACPQAPGSDAGRIFEKGPRTLVARFTLLLLTFLAGCARPSDAPEGILRLSQRNEPSVLDPALATLPDEFFILRGLLEGLVAPAPNGGEPLPAAAERWTVSPDGRTYTFHLRPDGRWSNGEPVTAQDFIASYRRALTPSTAAPKANLFFLVEGAEAFYRGTLTDFAQTGFSAADDRTLVIRLARPAPQFPFYAASGPWLPVNPRAVDRHGANWTRPAHFVGNGPFTLVEWRPHQRIVLARRDDHPDSDRVHVAALHFVAMDNGDAEERAFRAGQIDVTMSVPASKLAGYAAASPRVLVRSPLHETRYLAFNTRRGPLADVRVRRALGLAIDRQALVSRVVLGEQRPTATYVPSGIGGYISPAAPRSHNPEEARRLLADAGFPGGAGFPILEFTTWTNIAALETIQSMWKEELGIDVRLALREARVHLANLASGNYDIAFATAIPDVADPAEVLDSFRAGTPANYPQWNSPAFEAALETAARASSAAARLESLADAERLLLAESPVAPLYFSMRNYLVSPRLQGWREDTLWNRFYLDVRLDDER